MKPQYKIIVISLFSGLFFWILDAILDFLFFYNAPFAELLILNVPARGLITRLLALGSFLLLGILMSRMIPKNGRTVNMPTSNRDATELKRIEEIKGLADFTSENPQPSLRISKDGTLLYANAASAPIILGGEYKVGKAVSENWRQLVNEVLSTGIRENIELEHKGRTYSFIAVPVTKANYVNLYGRDITDRKNAEKALHKAYQELQNTQYQLIQAEKMNVVGTLASGVAHEVKNPIAIILQGINYLSKNIKSDDKDIASLLAYMEDAVKRADDIIKGLLDFSSLSTLDAKPENINSVIEKSLSLIKHQSDKNRVEIVTRLDSHLPAIDIDKNRIEQVIVNLFLNAVQAMPEGGTLTVTTHPQKILKHVGPTTPGEKDILDFEEKFVVVDIEDTGCGIPEENLDKIFDPFFTTKRAKGSSGLGLSIVRNIIDMHHGTIEVKNKKIGVKITVSLRT